MQQRSQAWRGKSGQECPLVAVVPPHFFPKPLPFPTNARAAPARTAPPFSVPICKRGAGDQSEVRSVVLCGPCFGEFHVMNPMACIHVFVKDHRKLFGKCHSWIRLALPPPGDTRVTMKDEGHRRKELPSSLICGVIAVPPQAGGARLSGREAPDSSGSVAGAGRVSPRFGAHWRASLWQGRKEPLHHKVKCLWFALGGGREKRRQ